jgi:hypothetical protein
MRVADEIDDARTVVRNLRYVHEHATDSAELSKAVLRCWWAVWTTVVHSTSAGVPILSAVGMWGS